MGTRWRTLRRRILTPDVSETSLDVRGFHKKSPAAQELLETVGKRFLEGYAYAAEAATVQECADRLDQIPPRFRGFAYEGAGMGFGVRDGLPFGRSSNNDEFLAGPGEPHNYLILVGIGWAMARLPRFAWPKADKYDPVLRWLVLDGYGFHQAYFKTAKYVEGQYQEPRFPWPADDPTGYAANAIDQGIGRAMWFIGGTDPEVVAGLIRGFGEERHADLWAGTGLAASYACGGDEDELVKLAELAGPHRPSLAQGSAFATEARVRAGLVVPHTVETARIFCDMTPDEAAKVCLDIRADLGEAPMTGDLPTFEVWRRRIANEFVHLGGVSR
ncbi:DUF1702 family protein [Actinokineospora soli]